jgi:replicative DNA helicase
MSAPYAPEAEMSVLGGLLWGDAVATAKVLGELSAEDFHDERHRRIYVAASLVSMRGEQVETTSVFEQLNVSGDAERSGGVVYVAQLADAIASLGVLDHHIDIVRDRSLRRRLYAAATDIVQDVMAGGESSATELVAAAEQRVFGVSARMGKGTISVAKDVMWQVLATIEKGGIPGVPTGIESFDRRYGGFKPGSLVIVAGATSAGKSAFALQCAAHAAVTAGVPTAVFSIEMTRDENVMRVLANEGMIDLSRMLNGALNDDEYARLADAATRVSSAPMFFDDSATRAAEIRARARRLKAEHGLGLIVVDHIHDMDEKGESRREQLGTIARQLKMMAKELDVPVIAVAQMSRAPTQRADPRPQLSDLRETGDLEAVANMAVFVYRPEYYLGPKDKDGRDLRGVAEAIIAKNRNGPIGTVPLHFTDYCARFDAAPEVYR